MFFLSGDDGPTYFSQTSLRSAWYREPPSDFSQNSCLVAVSVMYVKVTTLPENSRMLNSSLFWLLRFKKKGAKHCHLDLSNFSHILFVFKSYWFYH